MGTVGKISIRDDTHLIASTAYATCSTAAGTSAKIATIQDSQSFSLFNGETVHVKFTYTNTAVLPTLNINGTGTYPMARYGNIAVGTTASTSWQEGAVITVTFDGECWQMNDFSESGNSTTYSLSGEVKSHTFTTTLTPSSGTSTESEIQFSAGTNITLTDTNKGIQISASHSHGGIQNSGAFLQNSTTTANFEDSDRLLFIDASSSNMIKASNITFDGSTTTKYLSPKGTWVDIPGGLIPSSSNPIMDGTASAGSSDLYSRGDHVHPTDTSRAATTHDHGYIYSDGTIDTVGWNLATISTGDRLLIADADDQSVYGEKIKATGLEFGTATNTYLRNDGTWATPASGSSYTATSPIDITNDVISHNTSGVTAGTYGLSTSKNNGYYIPSITVDNKGHVTNVLSTGGTIPSITSSSYVSGGVLNTYQYIQTLRVSTGFQSSFTLIAGETTKTFTISDVYADSSRFCVIDVEARDAVTREPLDVDWNTDYISSDSGSVTSLQLTVTINEAYTHNIWLRPILTHSSYTM